MPGPGRDVCPPEPGRSLSSPWGPRNWRGSAGCRRGAKMAERETRKVAMVVESLREIGADLHPARLLPAASVGLVIGILLVVVEVSFAALIFGGPLSYMALQGMGLTLFGGLILTATSTLFSPLRSVINLPQDAPTAILAGSVAALAAAGTIRPDQAGFMTVTAIMMGSAFLAGSIMVLCGRFRLANLIRFMPYPVLGGFMGGTGWLLAVGGLEVMSGLSPTLSNIGFFFDPPALVKWIPGVLFGAGLYYLLRRFAHFFILPVFLLSGLVLAHLLLWLLGLGPEQAREAGYLLSGLPESRLWPVFGPNDLGLIQWPIVLETLPSMATVALITLVGYLLNVSGIQFQLKRDVDVNRDLIQAGFANLLAGGGGSSPGYPAISLSLLGPRCRVNSRVIGLTAALVVFGVLLAGGNLLLFFPRPILGGLLFFLGISFLIEWLWDGANRLPLADYAVVLCILATVVGAGFLAGVGLGLVLAVILLVVRLSRVPVIRHERTGSETGSRRERPIPEVRLLQSLGRNIRIVELQGYMFFGSANVLLDRLEPVMKADGGSHRRYLLLDFQRVGGCEISAVSVLGRIAQRAAETNSFLVLTRCEPRVIKLLMAYAGVAAGHMVRTFEDLDQGLEWCEDRLLGEVRKARLDDTKDLALLDDVAEDMQHYLDRMERFETMVERMKGFYELRRFAKGQTILDRDEDPGGIYLVIHGRVRENEIRDGRVVSRGQGGPGFVFGEDRFVGRIGDVLVRTESEVEAAFVSRSILERLRTENLELAADLYRHAFVELATKFGRGTMNRGSVTMEGE
ncbi:MAG: STAS domain-containing protein [Deltaproteobacteria bacterium]|nr:STAS domain-containing protein [Deltaproteobacteria bacterium]